MFIIHHTSLSLHIYIYIYIHTYIYRSTYRARDAADGGFLLEYLSRGRRFLDLRGLSPCLAVSGELANKHNWVVFSSR